MRASLPRRPALAPALHVRPLPARSTRLAVLASGQGPRPSAPPPLASRLAGAAAAALLLAAAPAGPALAELQTVTVDQATSMARSLKVQEVNKGRIWLLFVLGASSLFGVTVLAENNAAWFPAIARANKALAASVKAIEQRAAAAEEEQGRFEQRLGEVEAERDSDYRLENAVAEGLVAARRPAAAAVDVEAAAVPAAAMDEAEEGAPSAAPAATYPAELDAGVVEAMAVAAEAEDAAWAAAEEAAAAAPAAVGAADDRRPLFEIGGDAIEASTKAMQQRVLDGMSLEQLQAELEERRAAAAGQQPPQGD